MVTLVRLQIFILYEKSKDIKGVIRRRKSKKDKQNTDQMEKDKQ